MHTRVPPCWQRIIAPTWKKRQRNRRLQCPAGTIHPRRYVFSLSSEGSLPSRSTTLAFHLSQPRLVVLDWSHVTQQRTEKQNTDFQNIPPSPLLDRVTRLRHVVWIALDPRTCHICDTGGMPTAEGHLEPRQAILVSVKSAMVVRLNTRYPILETLSIGCSITQASWASYQHIVIRST